MEPINSNVGIGTEIYAIKKAIEVQEEGIMKVLASESSAPSVSGSELTGLGQNLDIKG